MKRPSSTSGSAPSPDSTTGSSRRKRSPEERRQQSIAACRSRRGAESSLIQELGHELPVSSTVLKSCDKLAILRLATSYLKLRAVLERLQEHTEPDCEGVGVGFGENATELEALLLRGGFVITMTTHGEITYVSDNAMEALRCETHTILGTSIYDHVNKEDHLQLHRLLAVKELSRMKPTGAGFKIPQESVVVHLRSGSTPSCSRCGCLSRSLKRKGHQRSRAGLESEEILRITGKVFLGPGSSMAGNFFVGVAEPLSVSATSPLMDPSDCDFPFPNFEVTAVVDFVCTADMKVVRFSKSLIHEMDSSLGYQPADLVGISGFELVHAEDLVGLGHGLKSLYKHGTLQTRQGYRILSAVGGWVWVMTHASIMEVENREGDDLDHAGDDDLKRTKRCTSASTLTMTKFCVGRHFLLSDVFEPRQPLADFQMHGPRIDESESEPKLQLTPVRAPEVVPEELVHELLDAEFGLDSPQENSLTFQGFISDDDGYANETDVDWLMEELEMLADAYLPATAC